MGGLSDPYIEEIILHSKLMNLIKEQNDLMNVNGFSNKLLYVLRDAATGKKLTSSQEKSFSEHFDCFDTMKNIFPVRECLNLPKPVNDEEIDILASLPEFRLKTDFIEGIISLRKRVLDRIPTKSFNSKALNGDQLHHILKQVLHTLNKGSVPSTNDIWVSLCKKEQKKSFEEAGKEYERIIQDYLFNHHFKYFDSHNLKEVHKEAKDHATRSYRVSLFSEDFADYKGLNKAIKDRYGNFRRSNEDEFRTAIFKYLKLRFETLEVKLKRGDISSLEDLENSLVLVEQEFYSNFPECEVSNQTFLDFKSRVVLFTSAVLLKKMEDKLELALEAKEKLQVRHKLDYGAREDHAEKQREKHESLSQSLVKENNTLRHELLKIRETSKLEKSEKEEKITDLFKQIALLKGDFEKEKGELENKLSFLSESKVTSERKSIQISADCEKEKALLEQRLDYMNKQNEETNKKDKILGRDLKSQLKEQQAAFREAGLNHDKIVRELMDKLDKAKEKILNLESSLANKENLSELEKLKHEEVEQKYKIEKDNLLEKSATLKRQLQEEKDKLREESSNSESKIRELKLKFTSEEEEMKLKLKTTEEDKGKKIDFLERELLIAKQSNGFLEMKCADLSAQINEQKGSIEKVIGAFESKLNELNQSGNSPNLRIEELGSFYESEKKSLESAYKKEKENLKAEIEILKNKYDLLSQTLKEQTQKIENSKSEEEILNQKIRKLIKEKVQLEESLRSNKSDVYDKIKLANEDFEKKLELKEKTNLEEIKLISKNSEDALSSFKSLFGMEKMRLEERVKEEKQKGDGRLNHLTEEHQTKLKTVESAHKEELDEMQFNYNELSADYQNCLYNFEHETGLLNGKITSLELQIKDTNEKISQMQLKCNQSLESRSEEFDKERKELISKQENLHSQFNVKEKESSTLQTKLTSLENKLNESEKNTTEKTKEYEEKYMSITEKHEEYKTKQQETVDELLIKKLEFTRETALLKQQIEFLNLKLEEQTELHEETCRDYEESLYQVKSELIQDCEEKTETLQKEKEEVEDKLSLKKKELRELEQTFLKQALLSEKEKNNLAAEITRVQNKKKDMVDTYQLEFDKVTQEMASLKHDCTKELETCKNLNEDLKRKYKDLLSDKCEREKQQDNQKNLSENKIKFLESQKEELHRELVETSIKAEKIIDTLQKKYAFEKSQVERNCNEKLTEMEKKWRNHLREMQDAHDNVYAEMLTHNQELERELKNLSLQVELRTKANSDPASVNRKVSDLIDVQEQLKQELEENKRDKERKLSDMFKAAEREKEVLKNRISDTEQKYKEIELKRGVLAIGYEKEKARWNMEKEHLKSNNEELQDTAARLEKKIESLIREIEKLKSEREKEIINRRFNCTLSSIVNGVSNNFLVNDQKVSSSDISKFKFQNSGTGNVTPILKSPKSNKSPINTSRINDYLSADISDRFEQVFNKRTKYDN